MDVTINVDFSNFSSETSSNAFSCNFLGSLIGVSNTFLISPALQNPADLSALSKSSEKEIFGFPIFSSLCGSLPTFSAALSNSSNISFDLSGFVIVMSPSVYLAAVCIASVPDAAMYKGILLAGGVYNFADFVL